MINVILPHNCELSRLLVRFTHLIVLHGDNELVHRLIRLQFAIPKVRRLQAKGAKSAYWCSSSGENDAFETLYDHRSFSGRGCRMSKGYACLFVCFSTWAIQLEAVSDLSTESFLAAFHRLMVSDNGSNFIEAAQDFLKVIQQKTADIYQTQRLTWKVIPPGAPHMGGLWKPAWKASKRILKRWLATLNSRSRSSLRFCPKLKLASIPTYFFDDGK